MYRQIVINPEHRDYLRVLWRDHPNDQLDHYRLKTLAFGLSSSPFAAIRTLHYLADKFKTDYPKASNMWRPDSKIRKHLPVTARSPTLLCILWQNKSPNKESFYPPLFRKQS